jgi:hypothetical protein
MKYTQRQIESFAAYIKAIDIKMPTGKKYEKMIKNYFNDEWL